ncbi:hypothetical protein D3C73_851650 [compost metagenome]
MLGFSRCADTQGACPCCRLACGTCRVRHQVIIERQGFISTHIPRSYREERHFALHPALVSIQCLGLFCGRSNFIFVLQVSEELQRFRKFRIIDSDFGLRGIDPVRTVTPYKGLKCPVYVESGTILIRVAVAIFINSQLLGNFNEFIPSIWLVLVWKRDACFFKHGFVVTECKRTNVFWHTVDVALTGHSAVITVQVNTVFPDIVQINVFVSFNVAGQIQQHAAVHISFKVTGFKIEYVRYTVTSDCRFQFGCILVSRGNDNFYFYVRMVSFKLLDNFFVSCLLIRAASEHECQILGFTRVAAFRIASCIAVR